MIKGAVSEGKAVPFAKEYGVDPDEGMFKEVNEVMEDFIKEIIFNACSNSRSPENWDWDYIDKLTERAAAPSGHRKTLVFRWKPLWREFACSIDLGRLRRLSVLLHEACQNHRTRRWF